MHDAWSMVSARDISPKILLRTPLFLMEDTLYTEEDIVKGIKKE